MIDKRALKDELTAKVAAELAAAEEAQRATFLGATHEEAKPENDKDTRALEQSYLARGQAQRVEELRAALSEVRALVIANKPKTAALGAVVTCDEGGHAIIYFLAPHGGGTSLAGGRVQVVTPRSPIGSALVGKGEGDACELKLAGKVRELEIVAID